MRRRLAASPPFSRVTIGSVVSSSRSSYFGFVNTSFRLQAQRHWRGHPSCHCAGRAQPAFANPQEIPWKATGNLWDIRKIFLEKLQTWKIIQICNLRDQQHGEPMTSRTKECADFQSMRRSNSTKWSKTMASMPLDIHAFRNSAKTLSRHAKGPDRPEEHRAGHWHTQEQIQEPKRNGLRDSRVNDNCDDDSRYACHKTCR